MNKGKDSFADLELAMSMILESYNYGKSGIFSRLFSPKIDKLLFGATKADHVTPEQHGPMVALLNQLIHQNKQHLNYESVQVKTLAIASVKATHTGMSKHKGVDLPVIQGQSIARANMEASTGIFGQKITVFPGAVPSQLPNDDYWQSNSFNFIEFAPLSGLNKHQCLPHVRMDQVLQFLLADKII